MKKKEKAYEQYLTATNCFFHRYYGKRIPTMAVELSATELFFSDDCKLDKIYVPKIIEYAKQYFSDHKNAGSIVINDRFVWSTNPNIRRFQKTLRTFLNLENNQVLKIGQPYETTFKSTITVTKHKISTEDNEIQAILKFEPHYIGESDEARDYFCKKAIFSFCEMLATQTSKIKIKIDGEKVKLSSKI